MTFDITVLVALAPGLLAASMVLLVAVPLLYRTRTVQAVLESVVLVGRLQEITHELSWVVLVLLLWWDTPKRTASCTS